MKSGIRFPVVAAGVLAAVGLLSPACSDSETPTSPGSTGALSGTLSGNVISGTSSSMTALGTATGLSGVTVRVGADGVSTRTDGNGDFVLREVPSGSVELQFEREDISAKGRATIPAGGSLAVTVSIVGGNAVIMAGGHAGEEIEGLILSVDAAAGTLKVQDQRLGTVEIRVTDTTVIRHGQTPFALADLEVGWRVHVKAMLGSDGIYVATEVIVQNQIVDGPAGEEIEGLIVSVDAGARTLKVQDQRLGTVEIRVTDATVIRHGQTPFALADLGVGWRVHVKAVLGSDGIYVATEVIVQNQNP